MSTKERLKLFIAKNVSRDDFEDIKNNQKILRLYAALVVLTVIFILIINQIQIDTRPAQSSERVPTSFLTGDK